MKHILTCLCTLIVVTLIAVPTQAEIVSVSGPNSSRGVAPAIIATPTDLLDDCVTNDGMQGFDEVQGVVTTVDHTTDDGVIPSGTLVDSHMIFLNSDVATGGLTHRNVIWTFDGPIIGVMSNRTGSLEAASTFELGNPFTNYTIVPIAPATTPCGTNDATGERAAPYSARGLEAQGNCEESGDGYSVSGDSIEVCMGVGEPGDWIRVITLAAFVVPVDIKPGSCPNPFKIPRPSQKNAGVLPVAILGTEDLDVTTVDPASIQLIREGYGGVSPLRWSYEDVGTPFEGELCDCHEEGADGYPDLSLKFSRQELVETLNLIEVIGETIPLTVVGNLKDESGGTAIRGEDCIRVLGLKLTCDSTTVPQGGTLGFEATATGSGDDVGFFYFASKIRLPNGKKTGWLVGPVKVALDSYGVMSTHLSQGIPIGAPIGTYIYHGYVGRPGEGIFFEDQLEFAVTE
jgi:hypothetical protein